jgi:protein SCO1
VTRLAALWLAVLFSVLCTAGEARAQIAAMPPELEDVGVTEHLDGPLPLDLEFRDHTGKTMKLRDVFDGKKPVVLTFAYHTCPVVCSMIANNLARTMREVSWTLGEQFTALTISIDPNEKLEDAAKKRASVLAEYGRSNQGWHFLMGDAKTIAAVTSAAGFKYKYDPDQKQWAHTSLVMVVKPDGRMARYLYGFEAPAADLKLALMEASEGRSISTIEQIILYCYHYDPKGGRYVLVARRVMQVGGGAVAVVLFGILALLWRRELRKPRRDDKSDDEPSQQLRDPERDAVALEESNNPVLTREGKTERRSVSQIRDRATLGPTDGALVTGEGT